MGKRKAGDEADLRKEDGRKQWGVVIDHKAIEMYCRTSLCPQIGTGWHRCEGDLARLPGALRIP